MIEKKKNELKELLKLHFGYEKFRPGQERAIDATLRGSSSLVVMPTGGGKSLCYQMPALVMDGVTIVVSPLIALMKDQVDSLIKVGIPATFINSTLDLGESKKRISAVKRGEYRLLYIAPERFYNEEFLNMLEQINVSLFAIDEAHCISQWGHDFRPSYLKLNNAISFVKNPPVMALTATATPEVKKDIIKQLNMKDPEIIVTGFSRPNLQFGVINANEARKPHFVLDAIRSVPEGNGIVYVGTRKRADALVQILLENDIEAVVYHAGMEATDRRWVQDNFMKGDAKVIVATNAFGLGIDKQNIRFVIHYDMPGTVEAYYQEAGRAGRDGKPSFCLLLYNSRDRHLQEFFIKGDNPPPEVILDIYDILTSYDSDTVLLTYSEIAEMVRESVPEMAIGTCLKILEREGYIRRTRERAASAYIKLKTDFAKVLDLFGPRAKKQIQLWTKLDDKYRDELENGWDVQLNETAEILEVKKDALMRLIRKLADKEMIEYRPPFRGTEIQILNRVEKSDVKIDFEALRKKFRHAYDKLEKIEDYVYHFDCRPGYILEYFGEMNPSACGQCDNCLTLNKTIFEPRKKEVTLKKKEKLSTKLTQLETFDLYVKGHSINEIAEQRGVKKNTIINHLCYLVEKGLGVDINKFVKKDKQKKILKVKKSVKSDKLKELKEKLGDDISYDDIKLTLAEYKRKK